MTQKFGHKSKKVYLKVYCNLIDIKMFTFAQIFKKNVWFLWCFDIIASTE